MLEMRIFKLGGLLSLLPQTMRRKDMGLREGVLPCCEVQVVFKVRRDDVLDVAALRLDCLTDFGCEADGGEDGEGASCELD